MSSVTGFASTCPLPISDYPQVLLAHGGGGRMTQQLIERLLLPAFANPALAARHDGAVLSVAGGRLAFTTDSYVVRPLVFPGGDIGTLAVNGTVNDLAMCGARPLALSLGLILEEGLPMDTLWQVVQSLQQAAAVAGVAIVTGDTKVVDRGRGDGVYINTAGIGVIEHALTIAPASVRAGDAILLSGDLGRHGIAVMAVREGLAFENPVESDCAPLTDLALSLLEAGVAVRCMRDCTRGGLASALVEIAGAAQLPMHIHERALPVDEAVRGACEILGLDPLYVACEGRFVCLVPPEEAGDALAVLRAHPLGAGACQIGVVEGAAPGQVAITSLIGARRLVELPSGEQLPRIC